MCKYLLISLIILLPSFTLAQIPMDGDYEFLHDITINNVLNTSVATIGKASTSIINATSIMLMQYNDVTKMSYDANYVYHSVSVDSASGAYTHGTHRINNLLVDTYVEADDARFTGDGSSYGVKIGSDLHLYRNSANVARLADSLIVDGTLSIGTTTQSYPLYINSSNDLGNGSIFIKSNAVAGHSSILAQNTNNLNAYFGIYNGNFATHFNKTFVYAPKDLLIYSSSIIMSVSNISPQVIIDGDIQFDSYSITPSFREKDGVKWKKNLKDLSTDKVYREDEALPQADIADIYSYTWTKEAQMKDVSKFLDDRDNFGRVTRSAQQKADEYNAQLVDKERIGVVWGNINSKYTKTSPSGEQSILLSDIMLAKIANLEKEVNILKSQ